MPTSSKGKPTSAEDVKASSSSPSPTPSSSSSRISCTCVSIFLLVLSIGLGFYYQYSTQCPDLEKLRRSVVLVTGVSSGIGAEMAVQYGRLGARLVLAARRQSLLEETAAAARAAGSPDVLALATDMSSLPAVEHLVREAISRFGRLDLLVLNHASVDDKMFLEYNDTAERGEALSGILSANVMGSMYAVSEALPYLERTHGHVAIISSATAHISAPFHSAYVASKRALHGYWDTVRHELHLASSNVTIGIQVLGMIGTKEIMKDPGNAFLAIPVPQCAREIICACQARWEQVNVPQWYAFLIGILKALTNGMNEWIIDHSYIFNVADYVERIGRVRTK